MNLLHLRGPVMVGDVVYPPGGAFGPRYQRDFQLVVIHAGELNLRQDDRKMHLRAGDGILLSPGHREVFAFARERETRHSWCTLQARAVPRELRPHFSGMNQPVPFAGRMNILLEWSRATVDQEESPLLDGLYLGWGLALFCEFALAAREVGIGRRGSDALLRLARVIREAYGEPLSLTHLARRTGISPQHLLKLCRLNRAVTPTQQLYRKRVDVAGELLLGTGLSVAEVAERCGFLTPFHFSRKFRQLKGRSPLAWRREAWRTKKHSGGSVI